MKQIVSKNPVHLITPQEIDLMKYVTFASMGTDGEIVGTGILIHSGYQRGSIIAHSSNEISSGNTFPILSKRGETLESLFDSLNESTGTRFKFFTFDTAKEMYQWLAENSK